LKSGNTSAPFRVSVEREGIAMPRFAVSLAFWANIALLSPASFAQTKIEATNVIDHPFSVDFASGGKLRLHVRSGAVHIIGEERSTISVEVSGKKAHEAKKLKVCIERKDHSADMRVSGGPRNDVTITIRIPRQTDLFARIPFGEVSVEHVVGNQDVELHAGDLTVGVTAPADYSHVDASVFSGEVDAVPFGEEHGGLFRSFHKEGSGPYRLHAHVGAGQLTLQ